MEMNQYLDMFLDESREHLQSLNQYMLQLEQAPSDVSIVGEIFRSAHTLKGMAGSMEFVNLAKLTHEMENLLDVIRNGERHVNDAVMDVLFQSVDQLEDMVEQIASGGTEADEDVTATVTALSQIKEGGETSASEGQETDAAQNDYNDYEKNVIKQALDGGLAVYQMTVELSESCQLRAVRAYMVFDTVGDQADIIQSDPPAEQLEQGEFPGRFYITLVTEADSQSIEDSIYQVSEVSDVKLKTISSEDLVSTQEHVQQPDQQAEPAPSPSNSQQTEKETKRPKKQGHQSIRVSIDKLEQLMNMFEEFVIDKSRLESLADRINDQELDDTVTRVSRISDHMQEVILNLRMVPVDHVFQRFPRMVRSTAKELGKKIKLEMSGAETELDRTLVDEIGDPLVHLLRNSMDHGIEQPDTRVSKGKPDVGHIHLTAYHSGNHVFIEITDDGAGINRDKVVKKAVENGLVTETKAEQLSDSEVFLLMFQPGFSTADKVSDLSGRGVGLDVVKSTIESLGGTVDVDSVPEQGTTFRIQLPLTLSIMKVLLVQVADETYAIPLRSILETAVVHKDDIHVMHGQTLIEHRDHVIPYIDLHDSLKTIRSADDNEDIPIVVIQKGTKTAALAVRQLTGQQEVVLKSLGNYLGAIPGISGATILGDGHVALILDVHSLI
ncbi:chemotaxis protein CheA [Tuberibacillus sp. Marseille-P3662]|uniref:chemotaxis protein CheA n=1 Tax=Tuberibacillus sp. Marseille-P3662 TaxID=1965358 RepID=UPI000A1C93AC|nr:chemotaxis protein CheA [Tuberibacillus sp. Marseille-P3662]